ncbi:MAG: hypothetical protein R3Y04_00120 [Rikenellaceae bacterium]
MKKRLLNILMIAQVILCATILSSCDNSAEWESKMQQAIGKGDFTEARACAANMKYNDSAYEKINRAQIAFLLNSGSIDQAYSLAQEEECANIFTELFMPKLSDIYESQGKTKTLQFLTKVEFANAPDLTESSVYSYSDNEKYNTEATKYNSLLEQFITYLEIFNNKEFATQLLKFVKPIVVNTPGGDRKSVELSNQPQEDIKKKLGL